MSREERIPDVVIADYGCLMIALKEIILLLTAKQRTVAFKIVDVSLQLTQSEIMRYKGAKK